MNTIVRRVGVMDRPRATPKGQSQATGFHLPGAPYSGFGHLSHNKLADRQRRGKPALCVVHHLTCSRVDCRQGSP